jgi:hypothetical protein
MALEPGTDLWVLVGGVVVEDDVNDLADRNLGLDGIEKADEFLMPVTLHAAADDLALARLACPKTDKHLAVPDREAVFPYDEALAKAGLLVA